MADGMRAVLNTTIAELRACEAEIERLSGEARFLRRYKDEIEKLLGGDPEPPSPAPAAQGAPARGKEAVRRVMAEHPGRVWSVPELRDEIVARGWIEPTDRVLEAVRTNLVRAVDTFPAIRRIATGKYVYQPVSENTDGPDSSGPSATPSTHQEGGSLWNPRSGG